jgi:hypothetical protein
MGYKSTTRSAKVKKLWQDPEWRAKAEAAVAEGKQKFLADENKVAAKAEKCFVSTTKSWTRLTNTQRKKRVIGLKKANAEKTAKKLARLGPAKQCACGCRTKLKPGRTWVSGHNAGITPRHFSEEAKAKQRKHIKTSAWKNLHGGRWAEAMQRPQSEEHKQKNRDGLAKAIAEGRIDPHQRMMNRYAKADSESKGVQGRQRHHGKSGSFFSTKMNRLFHYDSSWELERMKNFEADDNVVFYLRTPFRIPYQANGETHSYFLDFSVFQRDGSLVMEEIKPPALMPYYNNKLKMVVLKDHCDKNGYIFRIISSLEECQQPVELYSKCA